MSALSSLIFNLTEREKKVVECLTQAFRDNERIQRLVGNPFISVQSGIRSIMSYAYLMVKKADGFVEAPFQSTFLLFYRKSELTFTIGDRLRYFYLAIQVIGLMQVRKTFLRERKLKKIRSAEMARQGDEDFLYIWFLAQRKEEKSIKGLLEVKQHVINQSQKLGLPVYMETTEERLVAVYERYGFSFYHKLEETTGVTTWFGRHAYTS